MDADDYDLFVSYRWVDPDRAWVRNALVPRLRSAGLRVCVDVDDFVPGRDAILEMERAGLRAKHVLAVVSPDYFEGNRMVQFESLCARGRDPGGQHSTLIPFILRECQPPSWMRGLIAVDFTGSVDPTKEWVKLLRAVGASNSEVAAPPVLGAVTQRNRKVSSPGLGVVDLFVLKSRDGQGFGWDFVLSNQSARQYEIDRLRVHGQRQISIAGMGSQHSKWEYEVSLATKLSADAACLELHGSIYDDPSSEWGRICSGSVIYEFSTSRGRRLWKYDIALPVQVSVPPASATTVRLAFKPDRWALKAERRRGEAMAVTMGPIVKEDHAVSFLKRSAVVLRAKTDGRFLQFVCSLGDRQKES